MKKYLPWILLVILGLYSCLMVSPDLPEAGGEDSTDTPEVWPMSIPRGSVGQQISNNLEIDIIPTGRYITLTAVDSDAEIHWKLEGLSSTQSDYTETSSNSCNVYFNSTGHFILYAKAIKDGTEISPLYTWEYDVRDSFPELDEEGVNSSNSHIVAWADGYREYDPADATQYTDPENALGPADETNLDVLSLGNGGSVILTFSRGIRDGNGWDFAVFENGLYDDTSNKIFSELAFVEVSSNGTDFIRFHNISLQQNTVSAYESLPQGRFRGVAGNMPFGYGTPFDLNLLRYRPEVIDGRVDLDNITSIRLVDIPGTDSEPSAGDDDLRSYDSTSHIFYDPWKTYGSSGFDLDGIAVFNNTEDL